MGGTMGRTGKQPTQGPFELSDNGRVAELKQLLPGTGTFPVSWSQSHVEPMASQRQGPPSSCHSESAEREACVSTAGRFILRSPAFSPTNCAEHRSPSALEAFIMHHSGNRL